MQVRFSHCKLVKMQMNDDASFDLLLDVPEADIVLLTHALHAQRGVEMAHYPLDPALLFPDGIPPASCGQKKYYDTPPLPEPPEVVGPFTIECIERPKECSQCGAEYVDVKLKEVDPDGRKFSPCGGCSPEGTSDYAACEGCAYNPDKPDGTWMPPTTRKWLGREK